MNFDQLKSNTSLIQSSKWSQQLKSDKITINQNIIILTQSSHYDQFSLLDNGYSHIYKKKQSWSIEIKKRTGGIEVGICSRNEMKKRNFSSQHINWQDIHHGLYLIGTAGYCLSHSQQQFNREFKCFKFTQNDTIHVQYDPIEWKIRFKKNITNEKFQMPIIPPLEDDCYHPCVLLAEVDDSVEFKMYQHGRW